MAEYKPQDIERKWQNHWSENKIFQAGADPSKPKFYVLDMFPYPSGAGLHVGHPLGYIASDIVARFKRLEGFNVLHPMGFDAFGLPAEQYAIQTGQHPAITTSQNIERYKEQLQNLGLSFDWDKEVRTSDPNYYKWTQWIFMQLFQSWFNNNSGKAEPIETLIDEFEKNGNQDVNAACDEDTPSFSAAEWKAFKNQEKAGILMHYRLTYPADALVNWCPALGTVLANDEVKDGFSERGGHPVERKKMRQWMMRITAYADRLLDNLGNLDWSVAMKDMQANWIGKSYGCELEFKVVDKDITLTAFTTRPDTIFGVTYVVIAPEHELADMLTTPDQKQAVEDYVNVAKNRSERERMTEVKTVSGVFTGSYVVNPVNQEKVQLWVADYVLAGYGTGVVMAVPSSDDRDFRFAKHFHLPIRCVVEGTESLEDPTEMKHGKMINSGFINGMESAEAIQAVIKDAEKRGYGKAKINYRMRDAVFSRQRYWGEPVPVYFKDGTPHLIDENDLPLELPPIDEYKPTETGEPPLARATDWKYQGKYDYELTTMPGWAGSSWYFLRYMDAHNDKAFVGKEAVKYWNSVDLYIGGTEHATGHLLYSRFWNNFLFDRGYIFHEEPFKKLVNQGMIQGMSAFTLAIAGFNYSGPNNVQIPSKQPIIFVSKNKLEDTLIKNDASIFLPILKKYNPQVDFSQLRVDFSQGIEKGVVLRHVPIDLVSSANILDIEGFRKWRKSWAGEEDIEFIPEDDNNYICHREVEKMSKSKFNVVNPDDLVKKYGADTLRMYEMFLGPIEQSKPWNTHGIDGVFKFLRRFWNMFLDEQGNLDISEEKPNAEELKALHKTIKKIQDDINNLSFNTSVSEFMICTNTLSQLKCNKRDILGPLTVVLSPFAPHICEELWRLLGHEKSIAFASYPQFNPEYIKEDVHEYPIMINGKLRTKIEFAVDMPKAELEKAVLENEVVQKWLEAKPPRKIIVVPKKIINLVV